MLISNLKVLPLFISNPSLADIYNQSNFGPESSLILAALQAAPKTRSDLQVSEIVCIV